jgi:hypothetical protein
MPNPLDKTFGQLIGMKKQCERKIVDALAEFIKETGLRIEDLRLSPLDTTTYGDILPKQVMKVDLIVRLP